MPTDPAMIQITEEAARQFSSLLAKEKKTGWGLRVGMQESDCCGFEYFLDFSPQPQPEDLVFESHGVQIHVDRKSAARLSGVIIDYSKGVHGAGFKIVSPSSSGCSCHSGNGCCSK